MSLTPGAVRRASNHCCSQSKHLYGCCHQHCAFLPLCIPHWREELRVGVPLCLQAKEKQIFKVFVLQKGYISFHPHIPSPLATLIPSSSLLLSHKKTERKKEKKERNMLPGLEKSSFPRSGVIMLMEGRTGKRKCFANVENFWPAFFLRPVCQGEKEIGGWMKYELMQLQCL